ncbi:MAG: EAL domain-containing protein [Gammaproteobacteria bacterium]|nr:EAL domain-containing protein [Gammaproteobacteria bacterium]
MKKNDTIQLLLLDPSENDAVKTTNILRNAGLTLQPKIVTKLVDFTKTIKKKNYDLILFKEGIVNLTITHLLKLLASSKKNDALIIYMGNKMKKKELSLFNQNFNAIIEDEDDGELMVQIVKKEFSALQIFRHEHLLKQQLKDSEIRCLQLIESSHDAIAYIHEGMHILSNDPYYKMFAYKSREDIEAMPIMDLVYSKDTAKLKEFLRERSKQSQLSNNEEPSNSILKVNGIKENGSKFQIKMEFQPATMQGEACLQLIIRNDKINQDALKKLNTHCQETGLYNRSYFLEKLEKSVEHAIDHNSKSYLFFIVLDKFMELKEKLGDINTDQLIIDIAHFIKKNISQDIFLARFESYRFSAIATMSDKELALQAAEKIRLNVDNHIAEINDKSVAVTCSIGIAQIDSSGSGAQSILTEVQKASATAIQKGGNQIYFHIPDANDMNVRQLGMYWYNEINNAIKQKRMFLVFQPFVSLSGNSSENFEVFIRLRNEKGDTIFPREFLTPIESSKYSLHIDRWLIAEVIKKLSEQQKLGFNNRFIIKLTSASLSDEKFIPWVVHNLKRCKVKGESLIFQIIVSQISENLRQAQIISKELHKIGCHFSMDRFIDNDETNSLLKHVSGIDFIKFDRQVVEGISSDAKKLKALTKTCTQANKLNIKTIVPYVEEAGSLTVVWQSGADYIQGSFLQEASESLNFDFSNFS